MVKICSLTNYHDHSFSKYKEYFEKFDYPLHIFQKYAIEGIVDGHHVLVTAPTGSGKSLPAEFAIDYFHSLKKKTIYCSPIKALSNQKFYDFSQKYPHISIGLITGDIKTNPDADVLIMTTEILLNKLYQIKSTSKQVTSSVSFDMDIEHELGCVVFDEIHMINDTDRGHVWENSIMLLPKHIQMIGLSATLDNPERFAHWLENRGTKEINGTNDISNIKIVYLTQKKDRAVPLTHYSFITTNQGIFKAIKDKTIQAEITQMTNKAFIIQDSKGTFNEAHYFRMNKMLKLFDTNNVRVKRNHVLNQVSKYLVEHEMMPALCYVFSRKQIEICAREITTPLLETDSKIPYIVKHECEQIIRKLPNYQEYLQLPEYNTLVSLLEKGIATHHSGMMPILREIVEMLFSKGYVKLLFCTESVAIGLNLPVKTTIFTDVCKHDGNTFRMLQGHEFVQASGRAGRLGIDVVGNVFHLNNLFRNMDTAGYKQMLSGKPQMLTSKFKISYNLILNLIDIGDSNLIDFAKKSMITGNLDDELKELHTKLTLCNTELDNLRLYSKNCRTPQEVVAEYLELQMKREQVVNKKRKEVDRRISQFQEDYKYIETDKHTINRLIEKEQEIESINTHIDGVNNYIQTGIRAITNLLVEEGFIEQEHNDYTELKLTTNGVIASHLRETHCLVFAYLLNENALDKLSAKELVSVFSCFTNVTVDDDIKSHIPNSPSIVCNKFIQRVYKMYSAYQTKETINSGIDYNIQYELIHYVNKWCDCLSPDECKLVLQQLSNEKGIFLGEFVKALLKINNIATEFTKIAELIGNVSLLSKLREIENMTLKYVVTNQSLYV
jgi:superfamily II RNA helicase